MFERLRRDRLLKNIKENLSSQFKTVSLKESAKIAEIDSILIEYGPNDTVMQAKIDNNNQIHFVIKFNRCIIYHIITTNYEWFYQNINF